MAHDAFISYASKDLAVARAVRGALAASGISGWMAPDDITPGEPYAGAISNAIKGSRALILVFSAHANESEHVSREVERAVHHGIPIVPVRIETIEPSSLLEHFISCVHWLDASNPPQKEDLERLAHAVKKWCGAKETPPSQGAAKPADPVQHMPSALPTGVLTDQSRYYLDRAADQTLRAAISRRDSFIRLRGPRQVGKTSLLARGLDHARASGSRVVITDFQQLSTSAFESLETLFRTLGEWIADTLQLDIDVDHFWSLRRNPTLRFNNFICREVLGRFNEPLVWAMDEVDRLFPCPFRSEVFGLFRAWHNARAMQPTQPWGRLTLVLAYTSEPPLLIDSFEQSPFNCGTSVLLDDFTPEQVAELNRRHGSPLRTEAELASYWNLVGGHPYLVNRGFQEMAEKGLDLTSLYAQAERNDGIFHDHLHLLLALLSRDPALCEVVRGVLRGQPAASADGFYRLRSAGVLAGEPAGRMRLRCQLYASYLKRHLL